MKNPSPAEGHFLTIDVGTSSLKAAVYDAQGNPLAKSARSYAVDYPRQGWAEQEAAVWWQACQEACGELPEKNLKTLKSICVSGQAPACVAVDETGEALRPAILWLDRRASQQVSWLQARVGMENAVRIGGNTLDGYFGGVKWLWFRQQEPHAYRRTWKILQPNGYLIWKLSGKAVIDWGHAGLCSPCFNINKKDWEPTICDQMQINLEKLPAVYSPTQIIGEVSRQAAFLTGLPPGVPLVCGSPDYLCSCLGSGASQPGAVSLMLGTAGNLMIPFLRRVDPRFLNTVYPDGSLLGCGGALAGGAVSWFGEMLGLNLPDLYGMLDHEAAAVPAGSENLIFLPSLLGERSPSWDANARGVFLGLSTLHSRAHLYRAVLEGVAYAFRRLLDIARENGITPSEVVVLNGGARSPLWRQILADVLQIPVRWRPHKDGTTLGGAALAASAVGFLPNPIEIQPWLEAPADSLPNPAHAPIYRHLYTVYSGLYDSLKESFAALQRPCE